jgi:hypothetical protein
MSEDETSWLDRLIKVLHLIVYGVEPKATGHSIILSKFGLTKL